MEKKVIIILSIICIAIYNLAIVYTKPISEYYSIPDYSIKLYNTNNS